MPLSPARQLAHDVLMAVEESGGYASDLLHSGLSRGLRGDDRRLATELVLGTLRWQGQLDYVIERGARRSIAKIAPPARIALRLGAYQLRFLSRIPAMAAVHESVAMVKADAPRLGGFVNAVLRHLPREPIAALLATEGDLARRRQAEFSHPAWLLERWSQHWTPDRAAAMAEYDNQAPPTAVRLAVGAAAPREVELEPGRLLRAARRVVTGDVTKSEAYRRGEIAVQDEASQLIPYLLQPQAGDRILDACAAPGGKTAVLRALAPEAQIVAVERHERRAAHLRRRLGSQADVVVADGARPLPLSGNFDRILVDAPCTGTGTLARNPEIRWRLTPGDPARIAHLQFALVRRAAAMLAPGGRLVYSVCSIEPEETREVVERVLASVPELALVPMETVVEPLSTAGTLAVKPLVRDQCLMLLPGELQTDGFFAAALARR